MSEKRVLIYEGKHEEIIWLIPTLADEPKAFLEMFRHIQGMGYYDDEDFTPQERELYEAASAGDAVAAMRLARRHCGFEYEGWRTETLRELPTHV